MLSIGLGYSSGATISLDPAENWKVLPMFSYRAGIDATYPITPVISASLGLGLEKRAVNFRWFRDPMVWEGRSVNYFTISPGFNFSAFHIGMNIGFPTGGTRTWQNGTDARENALELDATADSLNVLLEPRIGAVIPVYSNKLAWFGITVMAGYSLNSLSDRFIFSPGQELAGPIRGTETVSFRVGVTGQFGIPGTERQ